MVTESDIKALMDKHIDLLGDSIKTAESYENLWDALYQCSKCKTYTAAMSELCLYKLDILFLCEYFKMCNMVPTVDEISLSIIIGYTWPITGVVPPNYIEAIKEVYPAFEAAYRTKTKI